jgi:ABC-type branched-subunit amino acid transport system ATPase component
MLAVATLSFALASSTWLFKQSWAMGEGVDPERPVIGGYTFESSKSYYMFSLGILVIGFWFARNIWRGGLGRRMRAIRDNEDSARAFTVPATVVKLQGFALAGILAGLGGALYGHALSRMASTAFPIAASINLVAMTVLGGIGILAGPLIGAFYIIGVPRFLPLDSAGLAASALGWLVLILYFPGGLAQLIRPLRDRLIGVLARHAGIDPETVGDESVSASAQFTEAVRIAPTPAAGQNRRGEDPLLEVRGMAKKFGGLRAVDSVNLKLWREETLGLIGPNGAGKTTLYELISGFTKPDAGEVLFAGQDISALTPEARGRLGLIRSFQDASLFPTMTVLDALKLAQERTSPTSMLASAMGIRRSEKKKEERARELVALMGLGLYRNKQINELSTGTRRITELACLVALQPAVLLLDEPSSGVAQRETEALGDLLVRLRSHLDLAMIIIEHDMPLIMGLADRIIALESGRVIAEGIPEEVRLNPRVVESYLGGDLRVVARSGAGVVPVPHGDGRCTAVTKAGVRCSRDSGPEGLCRQHARVADPVKRR